MHAEQSGLPQEAHSCMQSRQTDSLQEGQVRMQLLHSVVSHRRHEPLQPSQKSWSQRSQ